jgi:isopenicillin N synthase-like dioxygenase
MKAFFDMPMEAKYALKRNGSNARGFFDDELTKQKVDWKQALDFGVPGSRDWSLPDNHASNACLDGFNQLPDEAACPGFRSTMVEYFTEVTKLSERLAALMSEGLLMPQDYFGSLLKDHHTSYLRLNYYPVATDVAPGTLGISPHRDAGFLTVLEQDQDCHSLQAARLTDGEWFTCTPVPGAFTINTGDMAQMWSNGRYQAPLHRVLANDSQKRWSAPFFYNPGYSTAVKPLPSLGEPSYNACLWGYFRAQRFAGDFADFGTEIQTEDYSVGSGSPHIERQSEFVKQADFGRPFSVQEYKPLLQMS